MEYQDISRLLGSPSQSFFMSAIIEVYRDSELFGFTCYREAGRLRVYNGRPIYKSHMDALREAKRYCFLLTVSTDTKNNTIVCDLASGVIAAQSKPSIKLLGKIDGTPVEQLYFSRHKWEEICQETQNKRCHQDVVALKDLDGQPIQFDVCFEFVEVETLRFILARLGEVRRSPLVTF